MLVQCTDLQFIMLVLAVEHSWEHMLSLQINIYGVWYIPWWLPKGCSRRASMIEFCATKYLKCWAAESRVSWSDPPQVLQCLSSVISSSREDSDSAPQTEGKVPTFEDNTQHMMKQSGEVIFTSQWQIVHYESRKSLKNITYNFKVGFNEGNKRSKVCKDEFQE